MNRPSSSASSSRSGLNGSGAFMQRMQPASISSPGSEPTMPPQPRNSLPRKSTLLPPDLGHESSSPLDSGIGNRERPYPRVEVMTGTTQTQSESHNNVSDMPVVQESNEQPIFHDWTAIEPPLVVNKPSLQNVVFKQPVSIRYLKPPTPPPPGPIVIRERRPAPPPPLPPRVIRQQLPKIRTPEPLVIRERPPTPPRPVRPVVIEKHLPPPPRPPQQVIIERYTMPRRPRKVIFEKWLDYKPRKRQIILQKAPAPPPRPPPRNIIIEYSSPVAVSLPEYIVEGVFVADPLTYTYSPYQGELKVVDKIYDLPPPPGQARGIKQ